MAYAARTMKWSRFLLWLAGVAVFLLLTAHFTLRHALNTPQFKAALTGFVGRVTGRVADYDRIDYALAPFALVVRNARLKEADGVRDFAAIKDFSATVDFRNREITTLRLGEPTFRIARRPDGTYNFSDLLAPPAPKERPAESRPPPPREQQPPPAPEPKPTPPAAPPLAIRRIQVEKARVEFVAQDAENREQIFALSDLNFLLQDFAADRPVRIAGQTALGRKSAFRFELSGPPPKDYSDQPGAWPLVFDSRLDVGDPADLKPLVPEAILGFQSLGLTLHVHGAPADKLTVALNIQTPEPAESHPLALEARLDAELSLPAPVAAHLLTGAALPESLRFEPTPCVPSAGTIALTGNPALAVLLKHLQGACELAVPRFAYGQNRFEQGHAAATLQNGVLAVTAANLSGYGGTFAARGNIHLLGCPLVYRLERFQADGIALDRVLAANGLDNLATCTGRLFLEASASGRAVAAPAWRTVDADAQARIAGLQTVGTGGSVMDRVWARLDNPLLLRLLPQLEAKVKQAQQAADNVATTRYDEAAATMSLRDGVGTVTDARLAMPDYRLDLAGRLWPFDDRLELAAKVVASPAETARLTDGQELTGILPHENGGLLVPFFVRGSLRDPQVQPDFDRLLQNAVSGEAAENIGRRLERLSDSDNERLQKGMQLLQGLGTLLEPR